MLWGELIEFPFSLALNRLKRRERNVCEVWLRDEDNLSDCLITLTLEAR